MIDGGDVVIRSIEDRPRCGMWHTGPNWVWVEAEHMPSRIMVRFYSRDQLEAKKIAEAMLELLLEEWTGSRALYPDRLEDWNDS